MPIIIWTIQLILIPALSPLGIGLIKNMKAKLQNRQGASIFQPYRDIWKLLHKDEVVSVDASWIFRCAPYIVFGITIVVGASIPLFSSLGQGIISSDMLLVIYTLATGTFFLALAGIDTGSAFGGFGSSREMTISALAEGGFIFSLLTLALTRGTTNLFGISAIPMSLYDQSFLPTLLAFLGFFIVLLAETARFPFDNPATHLELTMIHEAMILEYSGKKLALMEWASANKLLIFTALGANLFFPFALAQSSMMGVVLIGIFAFIFKILVFYAAIAVLESSISKFRFFRLPDLLLISFIFNIIAIGLLNYL
ncbi:MAG: NADH-quinone oxidoreductase subunit H [bacterium]|nr:NADH-quinone oxidoreductase subunit H [bacterium]